MATERKWEAIPLQTILSNGGSAGQLYVPDSSLFKVKQKVKLLSNSLQPTEYEVKRIPIPGLLLLGLVSKPIFEYADLTSFTTADSAKIYADETDRSTIIPDAYNRATYEEEPVMAKRVVIVDRFGVKVSSKNPIQVVNGFTSDDLDVASKNSNGDPLIINFFLSSVLVATYTFTYDADGDFQHLHKDIF